MPGEEVRASNVHAGVCRGMQHGYVLILGSLYTLCWVSLIAGVKYRVQRWGGEWDGMMGVANSCNWHFVQGCAS